MDTIQSAVARYFQEKTGVRAVQERSQARGYPVLTVSVRETGSVLCCGGKQCERSYEITVRAVSDRERSQRCALLSGLSQAAAAGIPAQVSGGAETRTLHPLNLKTEGDALIFSVTLCTLVPETGQETAQVMETINLNV